MPRQFLSRAPRPAAPRIGTVVMRWLMRSSPATQRIDSAEWVTSSFRAPLWSTLTTVRVWLLSCAGRPAAAGGVCLFMTQIINFFVAEGYSNGLKHHE